MAVEDVSIIVTSQNSSSLQKNIPQKIIASFPEVEDLHQESNSILSIISMESEKIMTKKKKKAIIDDDDE